MTTATKGRSLRSIAGELGITPAYLSMMVNKRRPWQEDLKTKYNEIVNTSVNSDEARELARNGVVGGNGLEPMTSAMSTQRSNQLS